MQHVTVTAATMSDNLPVAVESQHEFHPSPLRVGDVHDSSVVCVL